jgi:hypothetical protein
MFLGYTLQLYYTLKQANRREKTLLPGFTTTGMFYGYIKQLEEATCNEKFLLTSNLTVLLYLAN